MFDWVRISGSILDSDRAHGLLDVLSTDDRGLLHGNTYLITEENGFVIVRGEVDLTTTQKEKIKTEIEKAILFPAPSIKKTRIELLEERIEALERK